MNSRGSVVPPSFESSRQSGGISKISIAVLVDQHPIEVTVQDAYGPATDLRPLVLAVIKAIGL